MATKILLDSDNKTSKINFEKIETGNLQFGLSKEIIKHIKYKLKNQELTKTSLKKKMKKKKSITLNKIINNTSNQEDVNLYLKSSNLNPVLSEDKYTNNVGFKTCFGNFFNKNKINQLLIEPEINDKIKNNNISIVNKNMNSIIIMSENSSLNKDQDTKITHNRKSSFINYKNIALKEINHTSKRILIQDKSNNQSKLKTPKVIEKHKSNLYLMKTSAHTNNSLSNDFPSFIREHGYSLNKDIKCKLNKKSRNFFPLPSLKTKNTRSTNKNKNGNEIVKNLNMCNFTQTACDDRYLKNINDKNNKDNICNFLMMIKINMVLEIKIMELTKLKKKKNISNEDLGNSYKSILKILNDYINILSSFKDNGVFFFINQQYNDFTGEIIKFIVCLYSFIFVFFTQLKISESFEILDDDFNQIIKNFSSVLYNFFEKFVLNDLDDREFNLSFKEKLTILFKINKYHIKSILNKSNIFGILVGNLNNCFSGLTEKIEDLAYISIYSIFESLLMLLSQKEVNDLKFFINTTTNTILYCLLNKNIQLVLNNKKFSEINYNPLKPAAPFLPKISQKYKYTLVLDMDETIIYYVSNNMMAKNSLNYGYLIDKFSGGFLSNFLSEKELKCKDKNIKDGNENFDENEMMRSGFFLLRPYAKKFLSELKNYYEIVIFTAGTKEYSDKILNLIELNEDIIKFRLSRNHLLSNKEGSFCKDLSPLGRDLSKVIIIDNKIDNFSKQKNNGLPINTWINDINDTSLKDLIPLLKKIVINGVEDVRSVIIKIKMQFKTENYDYSKIKYYL